MASNRYYSAAAAEEDEDDFMSDKFLAQAADAEASKGPKSYTQRRKEALKRSEERGNVKSRKEREKEAREEGLRRNLLLQREDDPSDSNGSNGNAGQPSGSGSGNKALEMMMKMGFKLGEALGKKQDPKSSSSTSASAQPTSDESDEEDNILSRRGIGSSSKAAGKKRAAPIDQEPLGDFVSLDAGSAEDDEPPPSRPGFQAAMSAKKAANGARIDPLEIKMRSGRGGLGVEEAKRRKIEEIADRAGTRQKLTVEDYRSRSAANRDERRAYGQLANARKTCKELDARIGVKSNYLWLDPEEEELARREAIRDARRFGPKTRLGDFGNEEGDEDNLLGDDQGKGLDAEIDINDDEEIFEDDELQEREEKKQAFLLADARERLKQTNDYLRGRHQYCLWCGTQYPDKAEMEKECPGPDEEEH